MPDIWQQFHRLPRPIRDAVAAPSALATIDRLEQQYPNLDTAGLIMRVMVKVVPVERLADTIATEAQIDGNSAEQVAETLKQGVFNSVKDYLGLQPPAPAPAGPTPAARFRPPAATAPTSKPPPQFRPIPVPNQPAAQPTPARPSPANIQPATQTPPVSTTTPRAAGQSETLPTFRPVPIPSVPAAPPPGTLPVAPTQAFSDEEAQEIAEQSQRLQNLSAPTGLPDFEELANQILEQHQLAFSDELLTKRAHAILKARLKDIRQSDETLMMLTRDPKVGGLGLDRDIAADLVRILESRAKEFKSRGMVSPRPAPPPVVQPPVPVVPQTRPEPKPPLRPLDAPTNLPVTPVVAPPTPSVTEPPRPAPAIKRPPDLPPPPVVAPAPTVATVPSTPTPALQRSRVLERPKVADITRPSRTYGPADEMRSMTVAEFRRLGQGAGESIRKLQDKFAHLKQESFKLWADAMSGWRQSEVYRLYLEMGRQSMEENLAISEIIQRRARQNLPYLSEHEFTAVADLNRLLQS